MNSSLRIALILFCTAFGFHGLASPWIDVAARSTEAPEAVAVAVQFVRACNEKRHDDAKALMTPAHLRWHSGPSGPEAYFSMFAAADLTKTFQYHIVSAADDFVRVDVKIHSKTRAKGKNFRLNLIKVDGKWLLTHKNK